MDRTVRDFDRNPFIPPASPSTLVLTLGMAATVVVGILVALALFVVQLSVFASTPDATMTKASFFDPIGMNDADDCEKRHVLRFEPAPAIDAPVTDLAFAHAELVATCEGEEPRAVLSADCVADPIGCLIVLAGGDGTAPVRDWLPEAFSDPMHPDPLPYGGADPHTLSMIERAVDGIAADGTVAEGSV